MMSADVCSAVQNVIDADGSLLPSSLRSLAEGRLHRNLESVRLHRGVEAATVCRRLNASAFTVGRHIVIGNPSLDLTSREGSSLLLHEVVHALQQNLAVPVLCNLMLDPDPVLETEAASIETALDFYARPAMSLFEKCAIQRHLADPCDHPWPKWVELTDLRPEELYTSANQAIELAYKATYPNHTVLTGSDFHRERWDILLPRGAEDIRVNNIILSQLRGLERQRRPDIIDFTTHVIYEIKTANYASKNESKCLEQLLSPYSVIEKVLIQHDGPPWHQYKATWYPPHHLPFLTDTQNKRVCTADTNYTLKSSGLILYRVYQRQGVKQTEESIKHQVAVQELDSDLYPMKDGILKELQRVARDFKSGTELWIVAGDVAYRKLVEEPQMERTLDLMRVHGMEPRRNPIMGFRNTVWTVGAVIGAVVVTSFVVFTLGAVIMAAAPSVAAGAGAGAAGATEAEVISLTAFRAARAAAQAAHLDKAAGVLLIMGVTQEAKASEPKVTQLSTIRAIPAREFGPHAEYQLHRKLAYKQETFFIVGRAIVSPPRTSP